MTLKRLIQSNYLGLEINSAREAVGSGEIAITNKRFDVTYSIVPLVVCRSRELLDFKFSNSYNETKFYYFRSTFAFTNLKSDEPFPTHSFYSKSNQPAKIPIRSTSEDLDCQVFREQEWQKILLLQADGSKRTACSSACAPANPKKAICEAK